VVLYFKEFLFHGRIRPAIGTVLRLFNYDNGKRWLPAALFWVFRRWGFGKLPEKTEN